jgi:hypothetical protein
VKHSKKDEKPKGCSKDWKRLGPIMIQDILDGAPAFSKCDLTIGEMMMQTDPTNDRSPVIIHKFKPLDDLSNLLDVLQGILLIKEGAIGNNVTAGPLQHRCWRGCLAGTVLDKFNNFTQAIGNKTAANSVQVKQPAGCHILCSSQSPSPSDMLHQVPHEEA